MEAGDLHKKAENGAIAMDETKTELQDGKLQNEEDEEHEEQQDQEGRPKSLEYGVEDRPPIYLTIILGIQVIMAIIAGPIGAAFIIFSMVCTEGNDLVLSQLINTSVFMVGVSTFLQVTFGVRLPIVQGSAYTYFIPIMTMLQSKEWRCPERINMTDAVSYANTSDFLNPLENYEEPWKPRLAAISGSLAVASIMHILLGATGLVGFLMRFIGPLTITPTVGLIGLMLYDAINMNAKHQWGIACGTIALVLVFSLFMKNITVPLCFSGGKGTGSKRRIPIFRLFCSVIATVIMWLFSVILTVAGAFPSDTNHFMYKARVDARVDVLSKASWVYVPYPGQWGPITISTVTALSLLGSVIGSSIESIGDYYATARVCGVAAPPKHAVNRGIMMEGICSLISGLLGAAHATTSYSSVMGFIGYTGNASRVTWQVASAFLIIFGIFGKFGAALAIVPQPIIGGLNVVGLGMCFAIAIGNVKHIDMESSRNQMVLAISFVLGVSMPMCYKDYPETLVTGVDVLDQAVRVVCSNAPLIGGLTGCVLDNIVPGTRKERGIAVFDETSLDDVKPQNIQRLSYIPYHSRLSTFLSKFRIVRFIPFLPDKSDVEREIRRHPVDLSHS